MNADDDDSARLRQLEREIDVANRRNDHLRYGDLLWEAAQLERRRGNTQAFIEYARDAWTAFYIAHRAEDSAASLLALHGLPAQSLSEIQRLYLALGSYTHQYRFCCDDNGIIQARKELYRLAEFIRPRRPEIAGYHIGYLQWYARDKDAMRTFADVADVSPKASIAAEYKHSREAALSRCLRSAIDMQDLAIIEAMLKRLGHDRDALSAQHKMYLRTGLAIARYARAPGKSARHALLMELATEEPFVTDIRIQIEFLSSGLPLSRREKQFRSSLVAFRSLGHGMGERYKYRRLVAAYGINRLRLQRGLAPETFSSLLSEAVKSPPEMAAPGEDDRRRAFAGRAVRTLQRAAERLDRCQECANFSEDAARFRRALEDLDGLGSPVCG